MDDLILCGCILDFTDIREVYYRTSTDDFIYKDELTGSSFLIDGLTNSKPTALTDVSQLAQKISEGKLGRMIGIIFLDENVLVVLNENEAEFRDYSDMTQSTGRLMGIDLNCVDIAEETQD